MVTGASSFSCVDFPTYNAMLSKQVATINATVSLIRAKRNPRQNRQPVKDIHTTSAHSARMAAQMERAKRYIAKPMKDAMRINVVVPRRDKERMDEIGAYYGKNGSAMIRIAMRRLIKRFDRRQASKASWNS